MNLTWAKKGDGEVRLCLSPYYPEISKDVLCTPFPTSNHQQIEAP